MTEETNVLNLSPEDIDALITEAGNFLNSFLSMAESMRKIETAVLKYKSENLK